MQIQITRHETFTTVAPQGELDANSSIRMDDALRALMEEGRFRIHVDCTGLEYISSAGLGVFISFLDELRAEGGDIVFSGMSEKIFRVFELLGLHQVMQIVPSAEDAAKKFSA